MNRHLVFLTAAAFSAILTVSCKNTEDTWLDTALDTATCQLDMTAGQIKGTGFLPRTVWTGYDVDFLASQLEKDKSEFVDSLWATAPEDSLGRLKLCGILDWTSGFFPGSLWYAYELTGNEDLKDEAVYYTNLLYPVRKYKATHDIGFMINCSYGNAWRLAPQDSVKTVIIEAANTLCGRFDPEIGCIRSWDFGPWNYPVIIDNMMNLDLLFLASRISGDPGYKNVAARHAKTTMSHHFRPDCTSYHVVSYNDDGTVESKETHQGKNDESAWARGQGWAVYGYSACFRETGDTAFLKQAMAVADMIMERNTAEDLIPYWDFDAPETAETPRDASAAAIYASAFLELSTFVPDLAVSEKYFTYAENILKTLSSEQYLAEKGTNAGFILKHSTGSLPNGTEIDAPLNYADYYYLEALKRYIGLKK